MTKKEIVPHEPVIIKEDKFDQLLSTLAGAGYKIFGPVVHENAVVYDEVASTRDLPVGWTDEQDKAHYRLKKTNDKAFFNYVVGPQSWKKYLFPPTVTLWQSKKSGDGFQVLAENEKPQPVAFLGVRACELHAIAIQDKILIDGEFQDPIYRKRRAQVFTVAVNCTRAGGNCFCSSMNCGPRVTGNFDIALTEILDGGHYFVATAGSEKGGEILAKVSTEKADSGALEAAEAAIALTEKKMHKHLNISGIKELLAQSTENPHWEDVAKRCLSCANCTLVCPTCFCMSIDDFTDLGGENASRVRRWDSCFTYEHSYIHGGSIRNSVKSRYRQWLTHKFSSWIDQFGTSGCVGCGRCITWCPAAIDVTEEVDAFRAAGIKKKAS